MAVKKEKQEEKKIEKLKCTICSYEFYNMKDQKEFEKIPEELKDKFDLPIHVNVTQCPMCKASKKRLVEVLSAQEKKSRKEKLAKQLKEAAEKEKQEELESKEIAATVCDYIYDRLLDEVSILEQELKDSKITIKQFQRLLYERASSIVMLRKKEYYPSIHFISSIQSIVSEFNQDVEKAFEPLKDKVARYMTRKEQKELKPLEKQFDKEMEPTEKWSDKYFGRIKHKETK